MSIDLFHGEIRWNNTQNKWEYVKHTAHGFTNSYHWSQSTAESSAWNDISNNVIDEVTMFTKVGYYKKTLKNWKKKSSDRDVSISDADLLKFMRKQVALSESQLKQNKELLDQNKYLKERVDVLERLSEVYYDKAQKYDKLKEVFA